MVFARKALGSVAVMVAIALLTAACSGPSSGSATPADQGAAGAQQVTVKMSEMKFDPSTITVSVGKPVKLTVQNVGTVQHILAIKGYEMVTLVADAGASASTVFTPDKTGTFDIVCTEPGHEEAGMKGQLIVQ